MKKKILFSLLFAILFLAITQLNSNASSIPRVNIEGDISNMHVKSDIRKAKITYIGDELNFESYIEIKLQGSSSLAYEKKNYTIKLFKDEEHTEKNKVEVNKDWGKQSKYCLKANWVDDITQSRNVVSARIAAKVQAKYNVFTNTPHNGTIDGFPVEIYNNDEFLGVYTWNIPKDDWLWNIDSKDEKQYTLEGDGYTDATAFKGNFEKFEDNVFTVEAGTESEEALKHLQRTIDFVKDSSDEEFKEKFSEYFDFDSSLNYILCCYYFGARDNTQKNMMLVSYDGKKFYPSLYDLDTTYGVEWDGTKKVEYDTVFDIEGDSLLWQRVFKLFSNEVAQRWFELREDIFTKEATMKEFRDFYSLIPEETWQKERARWGEDLRGFGLDQIEEFLDFRIKFVDDIMEKKFTPEYKEQLEKQKQEIKLKTDEDIGNFNKRLLPMLAVVAGIIVVLIIVEMIMRIKKRK